MERLPFKDVVKVTSGYELIPINPNDQMDIELIDDLTASCKNFSALCKKAKRRFFGNRINEVSRAIENELVEEIRKTGIKPKILASMGYPDIELTDRHERLTYLEIKVSSLTKYSTLRTFYYSSGRKIENNARHLLLGLLIKEEKDKYWKMEKWTLIDLSKLMVNLKTEFNTNNIEIYKPESIIAEA